jgi:hypothetical protein
MGWNWRYKEEMFIMEDYDYIVDCGNVYLL